MTAKPLPQVGPIDRPFWEAARRGELVLQRCRACGAAILPANPWCPRCWSALLDWEPASGRGTIVSFTVVHQAASEAFAGDVPYVLAVARLDEGPQLMGNIVDGPSDQVAIGRAVRVVFEERGEWSLPQFTLDA